MRHRSTQQADSDMEEVRRQLADWRETHRPPTPIPAEIWARAIELAQKHGLSPTARALRLDYGLLKQKVESQGEPLQPCPAFVELFTPMSGSVAECCIVLETERGTRVQVELKKVSPQWLSSMLRELVA